MIKTPKLLTAIFAATSMCLLMVRTNVCAEDEVIWAGTSGKVIWQKSVDATSPNTILFERTSGMKETVFQIAQEFAFGQAHYDSESIGLLCGHSVLGNYVYWRFDLRGSRWVPVRRAELGTISSMPDGIESLKLIGVDKIRGLGGETNPKFLSADFEITPYLLQPNQPESINVLFLIEGKIHKPYSDGRRLGDIRDEPLDKIKKDYEERLRDASRTTSKNESADTSSHASTSAPAKSPANSEQALRSGSPKPQTSNLMLFIAGGVIIFGIVVLISEIKNKQKKP